MSHAREVHPGVFVSKVQAEAWEPDPEVGGEWHVLTAGDASYVGMTRYKTDPGPVAWTPPVHESVLVLEGSARIEIEGGPTLEVSVRGHVHTTCRDRLDLARDDPIQGALDLRAHVGGMTRADGASPDRTVLGSLVTPSGAAPGTDPFVVFRYGPD